MKRTNRIESMDPAVVIITTQVDILRRVELIPIKGTIIRVPPKQIQKTLCLIACMFITAGILSFSIVISTLIIVYRKINIETENGIERYDLGDLSYGINNANIYLSNLNKIFIEKYFSDRLINQPGYQNLSIDGVSIENHLSPTRRNSNDNTLCSILFIIQNLQVYFNECSTCINERNYILNRLFSNITSLQQLIHLLLNDTNISIKICSLPNISRLIPIRYDVQKNQDVTPVISLENELIETSTYTNRQRSSIKPNISQRTLSNSTIKTIANRSRASKS